MTTPRRFAYVVGLVKAAGRRVTAFDLETAGFMKTQNQGITEVSCFTVTEDAKGYIYGSLLDPGCEMSQHASAVNGITVDMVRGKPHFTEQYSKIFDTIAEEHIAVVWNGRSFDCRYILAIEAAKKLRPKSFNHVLDVMQVYAKLENSGKACKLVDACAALGIDVSEITAHRAAGDVAMTIEVLDILLEKHGTTVLKFITPLVKAPVAESDDKEKAPTSKPKIDSEKPKAASSLKTKVDKTEVLQFIEQNGYLGVDAMAETLGYPVNKLEFALSQYVDAGEVNPMDVSEDEVIDWLVPALQELPVDLVQGQLKPLKEALANTYPENPLTYLQLRVGLHYGGFR